MYHVIQSLTYHRSKMASNCFPLLYSGPNKAVITKWRVSEDFMINQDPFILFLYRTCDGSGVGQGDEKKYKVNQNGVTVRRLYKRTGDLIQPGDVLLEYEPCSHSTLMKDLCAICGVNINNFDSSEKKKIAANTSVSMVHSIPELRVSKEVAEDLGRADEDRLLKCRKLVLLVDLDQTIIHSTNQVVPNDVPEIHHYQLDGANSAWYHTKFRPYMKEFLEEISKYYELHICTFGARRYAHQISKLIDPNGKYFPSDRILSRDEFFDPRSKTGNMKSLFPCGDSMVCIIDDRVDVWNYAPNVVHVKPYLCFKTDDINAPEKLNIGFKSFSTPEQESEKPKDKSEENSSTKEEAETTEKNYKNDTTKKADKNETAEKTDIKEKDKQSVAEETLSTIDDKEEGELTDKNDKESKTEDEKKIDDAETSTEASTDETSKKESKSIGYENLLDDNDDYLLYLKDILVRIHNEFYSQYEAKKRYQTQGEEILLPDLKDVIPRVRKLVLHGVNIVFSGVIPTNTQVEANRFYRLSQSLGAIVTNDVIVTGSPKTTHLVASKWGTLKVNKCLQFPHIKIVTPDWLIACAERWEKVEEQLFSLNKDTVYNFNEREDCRKVFIPNYEPHSRPKTSPPHVSPNEPSTSFAAGDDEPIDPETMLDFSPLSSFSKTDLSEMGKEVDDACSDGDELDLSESSDDSELDEESSPGEPKRVLKSTKKPEADEDDDMMNYENEGEFPQGWKNLAESRRGVKRSKDDSDEDDEEEDNVTTSSDGEDSDDDGSLDEEAAALERQFQSAD